MRLVVDASMAVKLLIAEEGSDAARDLVASGDEMHVPRLMASEIANALWRKARLGEIAHAEAGAMNGGGAGNARPLERRRSGLRRRVSPRAGARPAGLRLHVSCAGPSPRRTAGDGRPSLCPGALVDRTRQRGGDAG